ncbi:MAG: lactate utilization protein [Clostridiales bacterium]|nr:lactate utilization protein [Clostridiales bacterium]
MEEIVKQHMAILGQRTVDALVKKGYLAEYLPDEAAMRERLIGLIPDKASVGFGGSMTIRHMDIKGELEKKGCALYDHNAAADAAQAEEFRRKQLSCDVFLSSTNAVTMDGKLYNVDGKGNRVAAMIYGPGEVIIAAGVNKIVPDLEAAVERVNGYASPMNNLRFNSDNPCAKTGVCADCDSPKRICNIATILHRCPSGAKIRVLLAGESLGF